MIIIIYACLDIHCRPNEKSEALSDKARHDRHQEEHEESEEFDDDHDYEDNQIIYGEDNVDEDDEIMTMTAMEMIKACHDRHQEEREESECEEVNDNEEDRVKCE